MTTHPAITPETLTRLAEAHLFASPHRIASGVHPYDRASALATLFGYNLVAWQKGGDTISPARHALGALAVLWVAGGCCGLDTPYLTGPSLSPGFKLHDASHWRHRLERSVCWLATDSGSNPAACLHFAMIAVAIAAISRYAATNGEPVSRVGALEWLGRIVDAEPRGD